METQKNTQTNNFYTHIEPAASQMVGSYHVTAQISPSEYLPNSNKNAWVAGILSSFQVPNNPETGTKDLLLCLGLQSETDSLCFIQAVLAWEEGENGLGWYIFTRYTTDGGSFIESSRFQVKPLDMLTAHIDYISNDNGSFKYQVKFDLQPYEGTTLDIEIPDALNMPVINFEPYTKSYLDFPPDEGFSFKNIQLIFTPQCNFAKQLSTLNWKFQKINIKTPSGKNGMIVYNSIHPEWPGAYSDIYFNFC